MAARHGGLRELAGGTDGAVVLNTNDVKSGVARMMGDLGSYYLMSYYSTNTKLDGRFRRITVRVKRPGLQVRARPGYLAPTEADARAAGMAPKPVSLPDGVATVPRKLPVSALRRGPSTGLAYVRATEARFRRTERLRIEVRLPEGATAPAGRVLTSHGTPLPLVVTASHAQDSSGNAVAIADVTLAPLATGDYALELTFELNGKKESATYGFKIIP
jgi:hypothetical protein